MLAGNSAKLTEGLCSFLSYSKHCFVFWKTLDSNLGPDFGSTEILSFLQFLKKYQFFSVFGMFRVRFSTQSWALLIYVSRGFR
jgi:hypothetical protein